MHLDSIILTKTIPCLAEPGRIIVIGKPSQTLGEVLPYLATLPGIIAWNPETLTLTFRRPHGFMTLYNDKVYITQVVDTAEGLELFATLTEAVNAVWEKRAELVAVTTKKRAPAASGYLGTATALQLQAMWRGYLSGFRGWSVATQAGTGRVPPPAI